MRRSAGLPRLDGMAAVDIVVVIVVVAVVVGRADRSRPIHERVRHMTGKMHVRASAANARCRCGATAAAANATPAAASIGGCF